MSVDQFTFETIPFQFSWQLSKGSLGQIMKAFEYTSEKCTSPSNSYEEVMFGRLKVLIDQVLEEFKKFLVYDSDQQRDVVWYTLCGYNGRISGRVILNGMHSNVRYEKANFGPLLKGAIQRCQFILQRDVPEMYTKNPIMSIAFNNLRATLDVFCTLLESLEKEWTTLVANARVAGGVRPRPINRVRSVYPRLTQFQPIYPSHFVQYYPIHYQTGQYYNLQTNQHVDLPENFNDFSPQPNTRQYDDMYGHATELNTEPNAEQNTRPTGRQNIRPTGGQNTRSTGRQNTRQINEQNTRPPSRQNTRQMILGDFMPLDQLRRERRNALIPGTNEYNQAVDASINPTLSSTSKD